MSDLKTYNLNLKTINLFQKCFKSNGKHKNKENIIWQFLENPENNSIVDICHDEKKNRTASIYAIFCVKFKIGDNLFKAAQTVDTITDIKYWGQGLFVKQAIDVYSKAIKTDMSLVYGFPNGNSVKSFTKKLEWEIMDPVPFLIKPLKTKYFTKKLSFLRFLPNINIPINPSYNKNNYKLKEVHDFHLGINLIWKKFSKNIQVSINRNKEYLHWRYVLKPNESYKIIDCYDTGNEYLGSCVYTVKSKHNGRVGYIMELIYDLEKPKSGKLLLKFAIEKIKKSEADCILVWCFEHSPNFKIFKNQLFFKLPEKLRPIELHFGVKSLNNDISSIVNKRDNWYISYSDSDTV